MAPALTEVVSMKGHLHDPDWLDSVVYVGRRFSMGDWNLPAHPLANPYRIGRDGTREEVIAQYREWLHADAERVALARSLRGERLGCWCQPLPCHADVIAEVADRQDENPATV